MWGSVGQGVPCTQKGSNPPLWKAQHSPGWQSLWLSQMVPLLPLEVLLVQRPHTHSWSPQHSESRVQTCRGAGKHSCSEKSPEGSVLPSPIGQIETKVSGWAAGQEGEKLPLPHPKGYSGVAGRAHRRGPSQGRARCGASSSALPPLRPP